MNIAENSLIKNVVALGKFDGVHIGHRALINKAVLIAKKMNINSLVCTILPLNAYKEITTEGKKEEIIKSLGADYVVKEYLTEDFKKLSPEDFVKNILLEKYNCAHVVVGYNFKFGAERSGNVSLLSALCEKYNIGITIIESIMQENTDGVLEPVSSTRIRKLIESGNTDETKKCLGRDFCMWGKVSEGKHLGRKIGFPTVNFYPAENDLIPKHGVYAVKLYIEDREFWGITNVGVNPTVEKGKNIKIETYIFNFDGSEIYGLDIRVKFIEFIRSEIMFDSIEHLKMQIGKDKNYVFEKYLLRRV